MKVTRGLQLKVLGGVALLLLSVAPARADQAQFVQCHSRSSFAPDTALHQIDPGVSGVCGHVPQVDWRLCADVFLNQLKKNDAALATGPSRILMIETPDSNAFLLDHSRIAITRGLVNSLSRPDELRFVIAHELGHYLDDQAMLSAVPGFSRLDNLDGNPEVSADRYAAGAVSPALGDSLSYLDVFYRLLPPARLQSRETAPGIAFRANPDSSATY